MRAKHKISIYQHPFEKGLDNHLHKLSRMLVNENQVIGLESLKVSNVVRNRKLVLPIHRREDTRCQPVESSSPLVSQDTKHLDEAGSLVATLGIPWVQPGVDVNRRQASYLPVKR